MNYPRAKVSPSSEAITMASERKKNASFFTLTRLPDIFLSNRSSRFEAHVRRNVRFRSLWDLLQLTRKIKERIREVRAADIEK